MKFSVLMSVYDKESPRFLRECLESIRTQSVQPDEVVIVEDGPINDQLHAALDEYRPTLNIVSVRLSENKGLGEALNTGLEHCRNDLVARMDTDDHCCPGRFELQVNYMIAHPEVDMLGGAIAEFNEDPTKPHAIRELPTGKEQVARFARSRCPVNHMTVMFRRTAILKAGGYQHFLGIEDYYLWARLLCQGSHIDNVSDILVNARVGNGMLARRRGWHYFKQDVKLQKKFHDMGFVGSGTMYMNILKRAPLRLMPEKLLAAVYQGVLRKRPAA